MKQAFINANSHILPLTENDITVNNPLSDQGVSTVTVTVTKGKLVKSFTSNGNHMSFLRWVDFPNDYQVSWTSPRIESRPTDGGLEWTPDHKSLIYRYDATLGQDFNTNEVLNLLVAKTNIPGLRTNIAGTEKEAAEAGGRPTYSTTGYSLTSPQGDGQRFYTLDDQPIQVLDIVTTNTGIGGQTITYSNLSNNSHNSTLMSVNKPAINGAGAFTIDKVIKNNTISNVHNAIYRAQLYLAPTGPKPYIENLNSTLATTTDTINVYFVPSDKVNPTISVENPTNQQIYSGETYTNHITANDNYELRNVTVTPTSQITGNVSNNNQVASFVVPNVTRTTNKTINLIATDTSGNSTEHSFNIAIKPLKDKYRVSTTSTAQNPVRIANISNNASISQEDQEAITNSVTLTEIVPNRSYATASTNEVQSKTVSNVHRRGNNADVTVTVTYTDGTSSTVTVPVKHTLNNVVAKPRYTVQGQNFPNGKGASPSDFFTLENGNPIPDATITWLTNNTPNKNNSTIGENITVRANILFDGETSPIVKESSYMVVRTIPKKVFVAPKLGTFPDITDVNNAKEYMKPINNSWSDQPNNMTFTFIGNNGEGPNTRQIGFQTRQVRVTYANGQTEDVKFLAKIRPDAPVIDANSVSYKAGLTNQEIKLSNVLTHSPITLLKADGTPLTITKTTYGNDRTAIITVSDALPDGDIKAHAAMSESNLTYTSLNNRGQVTNERHSETVDSLDSDSVRVTPQLQAIDEGAVLVKGGNNFDFNHAERFIKSAPNGTIPTWQDNPDNWKNNVGSFTKTVTVTLPNGQGTRNVVIPIKIYPSAVAISPARDKKGTNLTHGTQAINYITFEPNQNTTGITAEWANNSAPTSNTAGVQNLTINVNYPGIPTPVQVPVKVYVYQFDFPQSEYTTTIGTTLASGIDASQYAHNENGDGLPTDGFTYRWNKTATGTNNASWAAMNKPNAAKVVNATYDVLYNGRTFATSQSAKFIVKNVQPNKPTISETAQGEITIAPGNDQRINTSSGNVTTYADRLVIKRNGNVITSFSRNNNRSPWTKEQSAHTVAGLVGTANGITVTAGTFNPADTIQVIATQGSGELTSAEQPSDEFTVVAPQPNQVLSTTWDNGQLDITPNNPTGNLVNPTNAVDITYTEKIANSAEQNKTLHVVKGANGKWSIADQPSYITLDSTTGKVTFNANSIKPNSEVTAVAKAGSGNAASSNSRTLTSPAEHTVTMDQIIKEFGDNVTAEEINNAVHVNNKRNAVIKQGTNMPTNLAGGSTTTIPVIITYNDGSTEEVNETIFTKSDKRELITANSHLDDAISTDGKTPSSINQYNQAMTAAEQQINAAKAEANQVIQDQFASPQQVSAALTKVQAAQTKIDQAKVLLQDKADNSELVTAKNNLQAAVDQVPSTDGMTQQSIDNYNTKQQVAQTAITNAQQVINNGDATAQEIAAEKARVNNALAKLNDAKAHLTADTTALQQALQQLDRTGSTTDKKPASIAAYNQAMQALKNDLTTTRNKANAIISKPIRTVQEVQDALTAVNRINEQITQAINQLQPLADNSELKAAKAKLDEEINKSVSTDGMTQESINAYQTAKQTAQAESNNAQQVIDNGDATDQDIAAEKAKVETQYNNLKQAITNLTPDKAPLEAAKNDLENDINRSTSTTGMTADSVANFSEKRNAAQQALQAITQVLKGNPDVATIRDNITKANSVKSALDTARDGLTVDKVPLENAKNELQQSITQAQNTSTTGMTQNTINTFNAQLNAAKEKLKAITRILKGSPSVGDINTNTSQTNSIKSELDQARTNLTPDKAPLETAKNALQQSITQAEGTNTTGMTQDTVHAFNSKLNSAKEKIKAITNILKGHPTVEQISENTSQTNSVKTELDNARTNLTPDKAPLAAAKQALQQSIHQAENTSTTGMTQSTINTFNEKLNAAKEKLNVITQVLNNNPSVSDINTNTDLANTAKTALDTARNSLTVDKAPLEAAKQSLQQSISQAENTSTTGMTQGTVNTFNTKLKLAAAKEKLQAITQVLNGSPTVADINTNTNQANVTKVALDNARNGLTVDKTPLETAKQALQQSISQAESTSTTGMTQDTVNAFDAKLNTAKEKIKAITNVLNGNPSVAEINTNTSQTNSIKSELDQARTNLTPDKAPLESAKQALELSIHQAESTSTTGTTQSTINTFNAKLNAAKDKLKAIKHVLNGNPTIDEIKQNTNQANSAKSAFDTARDGLTVDKAPLETAKNDLQQSITQAQNTSTTGMTQATVNAFNAKLNAAKEKIKAITRILKGSPSVADINTNTSQTNSVKSELDQAITNLTPDKAPLEAAKQALEQSINQPTDTVGMTTASLNAYNEKLEAARQTLNAVNQELAGQPSVQTINDKVTLATNAQSELDQARAGLTLDRQPTLEALQHATSLNQAQKDNFREQINAASNHAGLETIQNSINALNTAMTALRDSINDNDSIKTGINYTEATSSNRTNYDNAVNAAKGIIGEQNSPTMSPDAINQKANTVKSTKAALDGEQNLQRAKQEAIDTITNANDLNQAQKNALTQQVTQAQNVLAANDIKQNATALDTAMANLKQGVANHAQLVQDDNYVNADTNKKNDYDTAYNQANEIINGNAQNPTLIPNDVTNALQQVSQAETALNGSDNLNNAKQEAQTALGQLTHLNDAQRQQLQSQINDAHQVDTVNAAKELASNLDTAMNNLQNAIANNEAVKRGEDYLDADNEKQNNYNQAVSNAKQIISETTQPTMTVDAINQAINQVTSTKDALNGEEKLEQAKQQANNELNTLSHLNNAQKANIASKINDATNIANVNSVKQNANDLNTAMGNLQDAISNENDTLNSQNYRDASSDKQTNYTTAVNEAKAILAKNGPNKTQDQVNAAIAKVNKAKNELNGNRNLEQAQQTAKQALSQLTHLTNAQKDHLTTLINNSTTVADVQGIQGNANTLDQAMNTLKQSIADQNTVRNSEDYNDASSDNQNSYNNAVTSAEDIINASTNPEMSADTINAKAQQVLHAKGDLNGDENLLAAKQNAQQYLDTLSHITNQQKDNLNTQITNAQNISQVEQAKQSAQSLDTAMNNLQSAVNNENQIKTTENYTDADTNKQTAYDEAIAAAKAILNRDAGPNTPQNDVETALQRITNAQNELNGDHKINDAKTAAIQHLGTLNHLTTAQHNALENDINQATNLAGVEQVKQNADALNTSMGQLQTLVDGKNNVQNSQNYLDADSQNQSNYDMYLVTAEATVNKATGPNTSKSNVDTLVNQINQAQQALNGQQNLDQAKQSAINTIDQSTNLNTAQKDALKAQVTSGNRVADVNGVKQLATTLNTSMGNLRQSIANKAETLTNGNYINADNDKRNAYDTQVANAESIINGTNNVVLVPTDIDNATTSVTNAYNALNGDNNLRVAKENANNTIDGLAQLNNVQKANLKEQVQNARTLPDVQTVKTNAQTLNDAMRTLRDSVANEQTVKSSQNYTDANQDLQQAYDAQINNVNNIINETGTPTMDPNTITQVATQVTTAEGALNGTENLVNAQKNAKTNLNTLSHLTNAQKESITNQINSASHVNDVTTIQNDATQLNNAMGELAQVIQDQESTKQQVNYTNADQANQEAYNNAVAEAERILDKEHGANTSQADVQTAIQNVQSTKKALNGDRNVEIAKTNAKNALEQLTSLNNAQKAALTTQIDNAPTVANVERVSNTATQLNQAMAKLQQGINDNNDVLQSVDYTDADPTNQQAYTNAVTQANAILSKDQGTNADITQVQAALNQVTTAKNALNGEEKVAQAKEAAKQALATYNHLNTAQTNAATEQITNATTLAQVAQAQNTANELNTAMGELQNSINDQATVKNSVNFTDADQTNQEAYTNAVTEAKSILDYAHGGNLNKEQVEAVTNKVSTAKENLNGDAKVREAKADALNNLGTLNQLNDAQKAHLTNAINSASTVDGVNQVKTTAQNLNSAMQQLQQAIANKAETLNSQNYLDANTDKKNAYTGVVANAESILDKTSGTNADQNAVE